MQSLLTDERYKKIALSGAAGISGKLLVAALNFLSVPIVLNYLGIETYAVWIIVTSVVVWMQLADFGFGGGLTNALAKTNGRRDNASAAVYLSTTLISLLILSVILLPAVYYLAQVFPWRFVFRLSSEAQVVIAVQAFQVVGLMFVINLPVSLIVRVYTAYQKAYLASFAQIAGSVTAFIMTISAVKLNADIVYLVIIMSSAPLIANIILWIRFIKTGWPFKISKIRFDNNSLLTVGYISLPMFILQLGSLLINELIVISIAQLGSLEQIAHYSLVQRIYLLGFVLAAALTNPFYPPIRESFERKDFTWVKDAIGRLVKIRLFVVLIYSLLLVPFGDFLMISWVGNNAAPKLGINGWFIITLCMALCSISSILGETLAILDILWKQIIFVLLTALIIIVSQLMLFPTYGLSAVYVGTSIATIIPILWYYKTLYKIINRSYA